MGPNRVTVRLVVFACVFGASGCSGCDEGQRRGLYRQRDQLFQARGILLVEQARAQIDVRNDLNGRPPETLSAAERARVIATPNGQRLQFIEWHISSVDREIESVQQQLRDLDNTTSTN